MGRRASETGMLKTVSGSRVLPGTPSMGLADSKCPNLLEDHPNRRVAGNRKSSQLVQCGEPTQFADFPKFPR